MLRLTPKWTINKTLNLRLVIKKISKLRYKSLKMQIIRMTNKTINRRNKKSIRLPKIQMITKKNSLSKI